MDSQVLFHSIVLRIRLYRAWTYEICDFYSRVLCTRRGMRRVGGELMRVSERSIGLVFFVNVCAFLRESGIYG